MEMGVYDALFGVKEAGVVSGFGEELELGENEGELPPSSLLLGNGFKFPLAEPLDLAAASDELNLILRLRMALVLRVLV